MLKSVYLLISFSLLFIINSIISKDVTINQSTVERVEPGESFEVSIEILKGDVGGFAKFQAEFPDGITVDEVENAGATFTFTEGKMKMIWLALPEDESLTVKYRVNVAKDRSDPIPLSGIFSYLEENNRMIVYVDKDTVQVGSAPIIEPKEVKENIVAEISASRIITESSPNTYDVTLSISQENIDGFLKIEEYLVAGIEPKELETSESVFSFINNKAKYIWVEAPDEKEFTVSYQISTSADQIFDPNIISGEVSFLDDNETKKVKILTSTPFVPTQTNQEPEPIAENIENEATEDPLDNIEPESLANTEFTENEPLKPEQGNSNEENLELKEEVQPEETASADNTEINEVKETEKQNENESITASNSESSITIPEPSTGVIYRVQIAAGHRNVDQAHFKRVFNFTEGFMIENHEGWVKYTTGKYSDYKLARDKRVDLRSNYTLPGPFVTAYNDGSRITVQEALMISNQKWIQ